MKSDAPASAATPLPAQRHRLHVNGRVCEIEVSSGTALLHVLRNDLGLNGPKFGCGLGECGACTVLVDGVAARSCITPVRGMAGRRITTLEGLGTPECPGPTQQAFIDCQAAQCGYCLNGMIMTTEALLRRNPRPTERALRQELHHNLCRCGTHVEILQAALRASVLRAESPERPPAPESPSSIGDPPPPAARAAMSASDAAVRPAHPPRV